MWNNSFRLALIQLIYQNIFQQTHNLSVDTLDIFELEDINLAEVEEEGLQECYAIFLKNAKYIYKHLELLFTDLDKTFTLNKAITIAFLIEVYVQNSVIEDKKLLIKRYLRIADKVISDGTVSTLHAVLTKYVSDSDFVLIK